jgi:hypothetical protein
MIVEYIRYELQNNSPESLVAAYKEGGTHLASAPECLGYELTQCADDPKSCVVRILWVSAEAHLQNFRSGPFFPPFLSAVRAFVPEIAEMRHYQPTAVEWRR